MKPILLVDIDGVLNVFGWSWDGYEPPTTGLEDVFEAKGYKIRFPTGLKERMAKLNDAFECVWATTWEDEARAHIAPKLGFGFGWDVIHFGSHPRQTTWKLPDVEAWCDKNAEDRRVAWVDDDLHGDAADWARDRGNTLLVSTAHETGLTQPLTTMLLSWAGQGVWVAENDEGVYISE